MNLEYWAPRTRFLLRHGLVLSTLKAHLSAKARRSPRTTLPVESIEDLTDATAADVIGPPPIDGNVSVAELRAIAKIVRFHRPRRIFEFGTFDGLTTLNMAHNAPEAEIVTLDLPAADVARTRMRIKRGDLVFIVKAASGARFAGTACAGRIRQIYGDSATVDYAPYAGTFDLVFVDGSHAYEYAVSDTRHALALLARDGGVVLWHDYGSWKEVTAALNRFHEHDPAFSGLVRIRGTSLACLRIGSARAGAGRR